MRDYDRVILFCYPQMAGGNFVINSMSWNDDCVLRDARLAQQQLEYGLTAQDKLAYYQTKMHQALDGARWSDLDLGCLHLFGVDNFEYLTDYPELIERRFNHIVTDLVEQNKYLFIVGHTPIMIQGYLKFWHNARVVFMTDSAEFIARRVSNKLGPNNVRKVNDYWSSIAGSDWTCTPPYSYREFVQLPEFIQQELTGIFHGEIFKFFDDIHPTKEELYEQGCQELIAELGSRAYTCNTQKLFSNTTGLITELTRCAQWIGIDIQAHHNLILEYYAQWTDTIARV